MTCDRQHNEHRSNQNSARAVHAAGLARHRSQPRDDVNAGDTAMVWRNNKLTGPRGWTGPGVVVAALPTKKTSFRISMRSCLLKCSNEQVRKATDAEWLGAELSRTLATELIHSRRRSGQRGDFEVEPRGTTIRGAPDWHETKRSTSFGCWSTGGVKSTHFDPSRSRSRGSSGVTTHGNSSA